MKPLPKVINRKALLALPSRKWDAKTIYDWLYVVPTREKHDSGYMLQAIVGVRTRNKGRPVAEIAAWCDDLCWSFPLHHPYDYQGKHSHVLRMDCEFPSGIFRIWGSGEHYFSGRLKVGCSLSSTDVELVLEPVGEPEKLRDRLSSVAHASAEGKR